MTPAVGILIFALLLGLVALAGMASLVNRADTSIDELSASIDRIDARITAYRDEMIAEYAKHEADIRAIIDRANIGNQP